MTSRSDLCWFVDADDDDDDDAVPTEAPFVAAQWIALTPKGCEPVANDPIAKNRGVFVFAGRDASRRYQFVCVKCNYGDRKPFTMTARHTSDVDTAAKRHAQKVHSLLRNRDEHGVPFSLGDHRGYTQWRSICFRTPSQQGYPPQQGGVPQQGYPPQQGGMPQQGFPPQQGDRKSTRLNSSHP